MKKNGEYVGVDEKFIPENEKYVDESLLGDKEKAKNTAKKFAKGYLIFFVIFVIFAISLPIFIFTQARKQMNNQYSSFSTKGNKYTFSHLQGTKSGFELRDYFDDIITNNKLEAYTTITVVYNGKSAVTEDEILSIKNSIPNTSTKAYEVSVDYADSRGQAINKVTIKDIQQ